MRSAVSPGATLVAAELEDTCLLPTGLIDPQERSLMGQKLQQPPATDRQCGNRLLNALPSEEYDRISSSLKLVTFSLGEIIDHPDQQIRHVYFPTTALISLATTMRDGTMIEAGLIGDEGIVGFPVILDAENTIYMSLVQHAGAALSLPTDILRRECRRGGHLQSLVLHYMHMFFTQVAQTAACNQAHTLPERLARWLLLRHDRNKTDELLFTHEFMSRMLDVRRAGVTIAANELKQAGLIQCGRGRIRVLDRNGLARASCECYRAVKAEYERYLGVLASDPIKNLFLTSSTSPLLDTAA